MELIDEVRKSEFQPIKYGRDILVRCVCSDDLIGDYEVQIYKVEDEKADSA